MNTITPTEETLRVPTPQTVLSRSLATLRSTLRMPLASCGVAVILIVSIAALFSPWIAPRSPETMDFNNLLGGMNWAHPLGTDQLGRDTLSRLIFGSRVALLVSLGAVGLGTLVGAPLGLLSAYAGKWVDSVIMRTMDAVVVFPSLVIAVGLVAVLGSSLTTVIVAIGVANVPWIARIVRSEALVVKELDYVAASRLLGASPVRLMGLHILPNCMAPLIVQTTVGMGYAVLTEAALGFIGVGVQPPTPTWGNMLQQAFKFLDRAPVLSVVPGVAIFLLVLAFNLVGDALRDVLDPRLRGLVT